MSDNKDVFISYSSENFSEANWVRVTLENNGIPCWMAPMSIPVGSDFATEIPKAIHNCRVFVLILSAASQASEWVPRELSLAVSEKKKVVPFMLDNAPLKENFKFILTNVQYDAHLTPEQRIYSMIVEIKQILSSPAETISPYTQNPGAYAHYNQVNPTVHPPVHPDPYANYPGVKKPSKTKLIVAMTLGITALVGMFVLGIVLSLWELDSPSNSGEFTVTDGALELSDVTLTSAQMKEIGELDGLQYLILKECTFSENDISALVPPALSELTIQNSNINDRMLASIDFESSSLTYLDLLNNSGITTLDPIACLADQLSLLDIGYTGVTDPESVVKNFTGLTQLYMEGLGITSLDFLSELQYLEILDLTDNSVSSLSGLEKCRKLTGLDVLNNDLTSLRGLESSVLELLYASNNQLSDISALSRSRATLTDVELINNKISDISVFAGAANLTDLLLDINEITDISALSGLTSLQSLSLEANYITSVEALAGLYNLTRIDIADNYITSTAGLDMIPYESGTYVILDMAANPITDLRLNDRCYYKFLGLYLNETITDYNGLYGVTGSKLTVDYSESMDYSRLAQTGFTSYKILDCPANTQSLVQGLLGAGNTEFASSGSDMTAEINDYWYLDWSEMP